MSAQLWFSIRMRNTLVGFHAAVVPPPVPVPVVVVVPPPVPPVVVLPVPVPLDPPQAATRAAAPSRVSFPSKFVFTVMSQSVHKTEADASPKHHGPGRPPRG